jgi:heptosyltransferase-2
MTSLRPEIAGALRLQERPRVTVVRAGALGDTLLIMPTLQLLLAELPGAEITLVGSAWAEALQGLMPFRIKVLRFDSPRLTPLFGPAPAEDQTGAFSGAHVAVVYAGTLDDGLAAAARRFCAGVVITWPVRPRGDEHATVHFARAVADLPVGARRLPTAVLTVGAEPAEWAGRWLKSRFGAAPEVVAVHPGSGGEGKCWPAERFAELIRILRMPTLLIEGPADPPRADRVEELAPEGVPIVKACGLTVAKVAALLSRCRLYVGNDSGMSHLAAAMGVATVAVFGPTDPAVWAPLGPKVRVVQATPRASSPWPTAEHIAAAAKTLGH